jgi:DNA-binding beta-propeller fold protein YncE
MKRSTPDGCAREGARPSPALRAVLLLSAAALAAAGCRRGEKPAPAPAAAATPAEAPAAASAAGESAPSIRSAPEPNRPPFFGLAAPRDAALDDRGRIWIADFGNAAIRVFDANGGFLGGWSGRGEGKFQLKDPCGVAISGDDVYVADTWNGRIARFSLSGEWEGKAQSDFYGPRGVAVGPDGRVWIADTGNGRIVACNRDLTSPKFFGKSGNGAAELSSPVGIAAAPSGLIYVADTGNRRIQVLDGDGRFRRSIPFRGWGPNTEPYLEADEQDELYASDPAAQAVVHLDRNGRELHRWTADDAGRKFARPTGVALDRKNRVLYVVNTDNGTIGALKLK